MVHLIWHGKGFLAFVITFAFSLAANLITNSWTGSGAYWDTHQWPFAVSLAFSSRTCRLLGMELERRGARALIDPKTGEEVVLNDSHSLFFIPMKWWGPILGLGSIILIANEFLK